MSGELVTTGRWLRDALAALLIFASTSALYFGTAWWFDRATSMPMAYYDRLAEAFLHGRLHLEDPPGTYDLTEHEGRWYVPFLPLPAVVMLPWVALRGVEGTNVVVFSSLAGGLSASLVWLLLAGLRRRGDIELDLGGRLWLTALFALGSAHWYVAAEASVWFLAQTFTVTFVALACWLAVRGRADWLVTTALAVALWARPNVIFTWPLLAGIALARAQRDGRRGARVLLWRAVVSMIPLALSVAGLAAYNVARFGDALDFGYARQNVGADVRGDLATHGQFNWR